MKIIRFLIVSNPEGTKIFLHLLFMCLKFLMGSPEAMIGIVSALATILIRVEPFRPVSASLLHYSHNF